MKKNKKIDTKFEIEEVENRVEFFFLSGVLGKVFSSSPYSHGNLNSPIDKIMGQCRQQQQQCGSGSIGTDTFTHHHHHHHIWGD